jgi:hypothetical protein
VLLLRFPLEVVDVTDFASAMMPGRTNRKVEKVRLSVGKQACARTKLEYGMAVEVFVVAQ